MAEFINLCRYFMLLQRYQLKHMIHDYHTGHRWEGKIAILREVCLSRAQAVESATHMSRESQTERSSTATMTYPSSCLPLCCAMIWSYPLPLNIWVLPISVPLGGIFPIGFSANWETAQNRNVCATFKNIRYLFSSPICTGVGWGGSKK